MDTSVGSMVAWVNEDTVPHTVIWTTELTPMDTIQVVKKKLVDRLI